MWVASSPMRRARPATLTPRSRKSGWGFAAPNGSSRARLMGDDATHIAFALRQARGAIRVVGFRKAAFLEVVASGAPLDLVVTPALSDWQGARTAELRLVDLRPSAAGGLPGEG